MYPLSVTKYFVRAFLTWKIIFQVVVVGRFHSITPSLHHSITPSLHHSITPSLHHSITPSLHHSITPSLHHSITPSLHHSITPSLHHSITPSLHHSITPSLHHSITPSLHHSIILFHFPLGIWKSGGGGGELHMKRQGILVGKFEFNSYGRLMWTLPELHYTSKRYPLKRNRFDY